MMGTEQLCLYREESGDDELTVLPRHTKVVVTGNNRTKSVLVGLQGVVKKAVGLGGWHWLVLKNGVEVKLQRNALSVLEPPTGNEGNNDNDFDISTSSSDLGEKDNDFCSSIELQKLSKQRVRHTKPWMHHRDNNRDVQSNIRELQSKISFRKLGMNSLWRYCKRFKLARINHNPTKDQMVRAVQRHFASQKLDEIQVIIEFVQAAKRLKRIDMQMD